MSELLDIINLNNEVVAVKDRKDVIYGEDYVRFAHIFLFNKRGQILLQQRASERATRANLVDPSVGGHLDSGEDFVSAAYREMEEEIGVSQGTIELEYVCDGWTPKAYYQVFTAEYDGPLNPQKNEVQRVAYYDMEDLKFLMQKFPFLISDGFVYSFTQYLWHKGEEFLPGIELIDPRKVDA